ncbi:NAC domain containing protein 53 [Striga asiatica]|uniref:NAC domain containing protein 53 n=1 Tax=Striga asiatica TaxID=4170 RepID=A0A5A7QZH2_STRAF|nr:NAC domain containing protein 53 [Striga asiatica]
MSHLQREWTRAMIPPGHHFLPTDAQLIEFYLLHWSKGLPLPVNDLILEADIYGPHADPRLVFPETTDPRWDFVSEKPSPDGTIIYVTRVAYALTKLSKINRAKTRIKRRAGPGAWNGQTRGREIHNEQQLLIGLMKMFTYEPDCQERREEDHWIMHEYSLAGPCLDDERVKQTEYVICKITRVSKEMKNINNRDNQIEKRGFNGVCHKKPRRSSDVDENNTAAVFVPFGYDGIKKINRDNQIEEREFNGVCHKKPRRSSDVDENNTAAVFVPFGYDGVCQEKWRMSSDVNENNTDIVLPFDDAVDMEQLLADLPELSPDSIGFGELTDEDFRILDNFDWEQMSVFDC